MPPTDPGPETERVDALARALDGIRDEVRDAVIEGDAQDCSSPDCIADAVYEIVRVRLAALTELGWSVERDVDAFLLDLTKRGELSPEWREGIEYARLKYAALRGGPDATD